MFSHAVRCFYMTKAKSQSRTLRCTLSTWRLQQHDVTHWSVFVCTLLFWYMVNVMCCTLSKLEYQIIALTYEFYMNFKISILRLILLALHLSCEHVFFRRAHEIKWFQNCISPIYAAMVKYDLLILKFANANTIEKSRRLGAVRDILLYHVRSCLHWYPKYLIINNNL